MAVTLTFVTNPLTKEFKSVNVPVMGEKTARWYIERETGDLDGCDLIIATVTGQVIADKKILKDNDHVVFCPTLKGGGGDGDDKSTVRSIAMIAVMVVASVASYGAATPWLAAFYQFAGVVGSLVVSSMLPYPDLPGEANPLDPEAMDRSMNYGFTAQRNAVEEGRVVPSLIGHRTRVAPPIIGAYRFTPNSDLPQRLRVLLALADDILDDVEESDIYINGHVITEYPEASYAFSDGNDDETVPPAWFQESLTESQHSIDISEQAEIYEASTLIENFVVGVPNPATPHEVNLSSEVVRARCNFPNGLNYSYQKWVKKSKNENHEHDGYWKTVTKPLENFVVRILYRPIGSTGSWFWEDVPVPAQTEYRRSFSFEAATSFPSDTYEFQFTVSHAGTSGTTMLITRIETFSSLSGVGYVTTTSTSVDKVGVGLLLPNGLYHVADNGEFSNHSVKVNIDFRHHGDIRWTFGETITITGRTSDQLRRFVEITNLGPSQYDIRAYISGVMPTDRRYQHTVYLDYVQEGITDPTVYRGTAWLALNIPATEDLNGQFPLIEVDMTCSDYYTGRSSSNPAWAAYYRLIQNGIDSTKINFSEFSDWATFCDTESLTVALYIDTQLDLQTILTHIGLAGRGNVLNRGGTWGVIVDKVDDPVHMFTSDDIVLESFKETFIPVNDRANCIVVWYFDSEIENRRTAIEIIDPELTSIQNLKKAEVTLYGVTNREQAKKQAMILLNNTRLVDRTISFEVAIDGVNCQAGDIIQFQHNLPVWGFAPGRVTSADASSVTCDIPCDFSASEQSSRDFRVSIRHTQPETGQTVEFLETKDIVNPYLLGSPTNESVLTYTLDVGETWDRTPEVGSLVSVGWVTGTEASTSDERLSTPQFRVVSIERYDDHTFTISAVSHYDDAYIDSYVVSPATPASGLQPAPLPNAVSSWHVTGGVTQSAVSLSWLGNADVYHIYYQVDLSGTWGEWIYYGPTDLTSVKIENLQTGATYRFSIATRKNAEVGSMVTLVHSVPDQVDILDPVENIRCIQTGNTTWTTIDLDLTWDEYPLFSLKAYRVEILSPLDVVLRTEVVGTNRYLYSHDKNIQDFGVPTPSVKVRVVVIDNTDNEAQSASQVMTNTTPSAITGLQTTAGSTTAFTGQDIDILWNDSTDTDFYYYEVVITHGAGDLRTEYVFDSNYKYTWAMNIEDGTSNSVVIKVRSVDVFLQAGGISTITLTNATPAAPANLSATQWMRGIRFDWDQSTEPDFSHFRYQFRVGSDPAGPWAETTDTSKTRFLTEQEAIDGDGDAWVRINITTVDTFGSTSGVSTVSMLTGSLHIDPTDITEFDQISSAFPKIPILIGDTWTDNSPIAGSIFWNEHSVWYNGVEHIITSGSTADKYLFWNSGTNNYNGSPTVPVLTDGGFIIATNISGAHDLAWNGIANQVIGSAFIQDAAITNAKIGNLAVTTAKITDLSVNAAKIADLAVETGKIANLAVETGKIANLAVSTAKIAALAVGTAEIADLAVTNGKINSLVAGKISTGSITSTSGNLIFNLDTATLSAGAGTNINITGTGALNVSSGSVNVTSTGKVTISTSAGLEIDGTGGMRVLSGGDMLLESDDPNYSTITWEEVNGSHTSLTKMELTYHLDYLWLTPTIAGKGHFDIGQSGVNLNRVNIHANSFLVSTDHFSLKTDYHGSFDTAALAAYYGVVGTTYTWARVHVGVQPSTSSKAFFPDGNNTTDCGLDTNAWQDIYYYVAHDKCLYLDDLDDIQILHDMGTTGKLDPANGLKKLDLNSLPRWMTNYDKLKKEVKGELGSMINDYDFDELLKDEDDLGYRLFRIPGHMLDIVAGGVRKLDDEIKTLKQKIKLMGDDNIDRRKKSRDRD